MLDRSSNNRKRLVRPAAGLAARAAALHEIPAHVPIRVVMAVPPPITTLPGVLPGGVGPPAAIRRGLRRDKLGNAVAKSRIPHPIRIV